MASFSAETKLPWGTRAANNRRVRLLGWVAALLFYPFVQLFPVYIALDRIYQNAREPCYGYETVAGCYRHLLGVVAETQYYECQVDRNREVSRTHARSIAERLSGANSMMAPLADADHSVWSWVRRQSVPLFHKGFAIYEAADYVDVYGGEIWRKIRKHCAEQRIRFLRGQPVEPIAIYDEVRAVLRETIRRYDAAIAGYARIRILFGVIMWGWAAAELAGLVLFLGIAREDWCRFKRARAEQRGQGG